MKLVHNHLKLFAILLSIIVTMQSCSVYEKTPITIDEAIRSHLSVKVVSQDNEKYKFNRVWREGSKLYGNESKYAKSSVLMSIQIEEKQVKFVYAKDKTKSTVLTVAISVGILIGIIKLLASKVSPSFSGVI